MRLGILGEVIMYKAVRQESDAHITLSSADSIHICRISSLSSYKKKIQTKVSYFFLN